MKDEKSIYERDDEKDHIVDTSDLWIVPYADFMTVIMIFFMLMFAFAYAAKNDSRYKKIVTAIQKEMGGKVDDKLLENMIEQEKAEKIVTEMDELVEKENLKNYINVNMDAERIKIVFANPVLFDTGKAELKTESARILHELSNMLKTSDNEIIIEGHTDNIPVSGGKFKSNWELSVARSMEVIRYFIANEGLPPERFVAAGYGEYCPAALNDTPENRARNRRIEINIMRKKELK